MELYKSYIKVLKYILYFTFSLKRIIMHMKMY